MALRLKSTQISQIKEKRRFRKSNTALPAPLRPCVRYFFSRSGAETQGNQSSHIAFLQFV